MNQIDLQGLHAIVTGGAQGIGLAIVKRLLASGAHVHIGDRDEIAAMVAWLASEDCSFTTAGVFGISGGRATY